LCTSSSVSGRDTLAGRPTKRDRGGYVLPIATSAPAATATNMAPGMGGEVYSGSFGRGHATSSPRERRGSFR
jgi:hypothetical protein